MAFIVGYSNVIGEHVLLHRIYVLLEPKDLISFYCSGNNFTGKNNSLIQISYATHFVA
jgi:hypothetical protein